MSAQIRLKLTALIQKHWGYSAFRSGQEEIILSIVTGHDTLAVLPTGAGKSLCYQIPGLYFEGITIVVSPLIALMKDQIAGLKERNIKAAGLFSGQSKREQDIILDNAAYGDGKFLFVSPERLKSELFQTRLKKMQVNLIAVDEAHCISEWGHDFRPEYRKIAEIKNLLPEVPIIAVTATATQKVIKDIESNLALEQCNKFIHSPIRTNLSYNILYTEAKKDYMTNLVLNSAGSKIIYVNTRKQSKELERHLLAKGLNVNAFHGGMDRKERELIISKWNSNQIRIMVATKAFGMGIDKSDVRLVLHYGPPQTLESYIQEAGRAGRDGEHAVSIILYNNGDQKKIKKTTDDTYPSIEYLKETYKNICLHLKVASGVCQTEFYPFYLIEFSKKYDPNKFKLFNALKILHQFEVIYLSEAILHPSRLKMSEHRTKNVMANPQLSMKMVDFLKLLLRNYEGLFLDFTVIDERLIARKFGSSKKKVVDALTWIHTKGLGEYRSSYLGHTISFKEYRYPSDAIPIDESRYLERKQAVIDSIESLEDFISFEKCRQTYIANYFGFEETDCKVCDYCVSKYEVPNIGILSKQILNRLGQTPMTFPELFAQYSVGYRAGIEEALRDLESEHAITFNNGKIAIKNQ